MAGKAAAKKVKSIAMAQPPELFYRINTLLYTLRTIAQREDQLCMLMHHLRTSGKLNAEMAAELHEIVEEIPVQEYLDDVRALQGSLHAAEGKDSPTGKPRAVRAKTGTKRRAA